MARRRHTPLRELLAHRQVEHPAAAILAGRVLVDGRIVTNPRSLVRSDAAIVVRDPKPLRGETKLRAALAGLDVRVSGCVGLDLGAAAGGFTRALLAAGVRRVYAVDAGHGQLLGSLRQDARVVNLEGGQPGVPRPAAGAGHHRPGHDGPVVPGRGRGRVSARPRAARARCRARGAGEADVRAPPRPRATRPTRGVGRAGARRRRGRPGGVARTRASRFAGAGRRGAVEVFLHARRASRED